MYLRGGTRVHAPTKPNLVPQSLQAPLPQGTDYEGCWQCFFMHLFFVFIAIPEIRLSVLKLVPKPAFKLSVNCICSIVFQATLKAGRGDHVSSWINTCARQQPGA